MRYERETNQIDQDGNFIFENKRVDEVRDAWLDSLENEESAGNQARVVLLDQDEPTSCRTIFRQTR